ncbi:MAG: 3'-5' exonuclease [Rhodospirillales bacterium]|jgi:DNA polymerase III epsilon subunit-like protein|nr:3'-5' exonuclease [Rhodospirillales bacterium]
MTDSPPPASPSIIRGAEMVVVLDLEWTAWEGSRERRWGAPGEYREVVQIGAVKLDGGSALGERESFDLLVRPRRNRVLSDYFIGLTGIDQARLDAKGVDFAEAFKRFSAFLGPPRGPVLSAGYDGWILEENCRLCGMPFTLDRGRFFTITPMIVSALGVDEKYFMSSRLPELLDFPPPGRAHDAAGDARCIAEALRILLRRDPV